MTDSSDAATGLLRESVRPVRIAVFGATGRVRRVLVPSLEAPGLTVQPRDLRNADAAIDFTTPHAVVGNVIQCIDAGVPVIVGTTWWDPTEVSGPAEALPAPNSSSG
jgi:4-hydroxy-tetrahydrodipicolinate reductase